MVKQRVKKRVKNQKCGIIHPLRALFLKKFNTKNAENTIKLNGGENDGKNDGKPKMQKTPSTENVPNVEMAQVFSIPKMQKTPTSKM